MTDTIEQQPSRRVRISGDGTHSGTTITDTETGEKVGPVVSYTLTQGRGGQAMVQIDVVGPYVDIECDAALRKVSNLSFGQAIAALKAGNIVARAGWNGKGMWLKLVPVDLADKVAFQFEALNPLPWIGMRTADQCFVPWLASQTDMLAEDWVIVCALAKA